MNNNNDQTDAKWYKEKHRVKEPLVYDPTKCLAIPYRQLPSGRWLKRFHGKIHFKGDL